MLNKGIKNLKQRSYIKCINEKIKVMKKFVIVEKVPAVVEYIYEVEAENEETAIQLIENGKGEVIDMVTNLAEDDSEFDLVDIIEE